MKTATPAARRSFQMRRGPRRVGILIATTALAGLAACGGSGGGGGPKITMVEKEFAIGADHATVRAGDVKVTVKNRGTALHELVAFRTDLAEADLPLTSKGDRIDESGAGITH